MFERKHYWKLLLVLLPIILLNIPFLNSVYDDLFFALEVSLVSCGIGLITALFLETSGLKFGVCTSRSYMKLGGLLPIPRFFSGLFWPIIMAWDDFLLLSDDLTKQWFWGMVICSYTGWIIGIISVRYRILKEQPEISDEEGISVDINEYRLRPLKRSTKAILLIGVTCIVVWFVISLNVVLSSGNLFWLAGIFVIVLILGAIVFVNEHPIELIERVPKPPDEPLDDISG